MKMDISQTFQKGLFILKKHSPEILVVTGVVGVVTSTVMACKATRKIDPVLTEHKAGLQKVKEKHKEDAGTFEEKKETALVYAKTSVGFVKLYGPSAAVGVLSLTGMVASNNILRKRNMALAAAYAALDQGFKEYRGRVANKYGVEAERELRYDLHQEKITVEETDEDGKKKKVKQSVAVAGNGMPSIYARYFAYGDAKGAEPNEDYNLFFLKAQQSLANNMLRVKQHLFLNEVYDMLGFEPSIAGQSVGWVYDKERDDHGDNFVDFGIQEVWRRRSDDPNDLEKVFLLDFNVDGNIMAHAFDNGLITE